MRERYNLRGLTMIRHYCTNYLELTWAPKSISISRNHSLVNHRVRGPPPSRAAGIGGTGILAVGNSGLRRSALTVNCYPSMAIPFVVPSTRDYAIIPDHEQHSCLQVASISSRCHSPKRPQSRVNHTNIRRAALMTPLDPGSFSVFSNVGYR